MVHYEVDLAHLHLYLAFASLGEVVKKLKICQNLFPPVSPAPVILGRPCGELPVTMENIGQNGLIHNLGKRGRGDS
jgi:hypothetical protein